MTFHVHRSNRLELLADELADVVERPCGGPLEREPVIVQSKGMERWVSMRLAGRLGVWANPWLPFPGRFLEGIFDTVIGKGEGFEKQTMLWSIAAALPGCLGDDEFAELAGYLRDDATGIKRLQLAERIARVFDQYGVYRPEKVLEWEVGAGDSWQALLWREVGGSHFAARSRDFLEAWKGLPSTFRAGFTQNPEVQAFFARDAVKAALGDPKASEDAS